MKPLVNLGFPVLTACLLMLFSSALIAVPLPDGAAENDMLYWEETSGSWIAQQPLPTQTASNMQPFLTVGYYIAVEGLYPSRTSSNPYIGEVQTFGFNFAPRGFLPCDGQLLNIASNTALFSLLGTMYGGDGRTTFRLPDLRGRAVMHAGSGPGLTPNRRPGQRGGSETHFHSTLP